MSIWLSMVVFSFTMSISPGPVNLVALTSGLNHGFVASLKFVFGATLGFIVLLFVIGFGLGAANETFPSIIKLLTYVGCAYLGYVGIKIYMDRGELEEVESAIPLPSFQQGWLLQWLNPKAWIACLAGCSAFNVYTSNARLLQFLLIYFVICFIGIGCWAFAGRKIQIWLRSPTSVKAFNKIMGLVLCALAAVLVMN